MGNINSFITEDHKELFKKYDSEDPYFKDLNPGQKYKKIPKTTLCLAA